MKDKRFRPIPAPTGDFILKSGVPAVMAPNGAYYHYVHVCSLLDRMKKIEQLRAYRVVYWRNVFRIKYFKSNFMYPAFCLNANASSLEGCNDFIIQHIRELQNQIYPPQTQNNG